MHAQTTPDLADPQGAPVRLVTWAGFALTCLGMFMAILDVQVVATSLPTIQGALGHCQPKVEGPVTRRAVVARHGQFDQPVPLL